MCLSALLLFLPVHRHCHCQTHCSMSLAWVGVRVLEPNSCTLAQSDGHGAMPAFLAWLHVRSRHRIRRDSGPTASFGPAAAVNNRVVADAHDHWTPFVLSNLQQSQIVSEAQAAEYGGDVAKWEASMADLAGKTVGLAVLRPAFSPDMMFILQPLERSLKEFWDTEWGVDCSLLYFDILASAEFDVPERAFARDAACLSQQPKTLLFKITPASQERLVQARALVNGVGPRSLQDVIHVWDQSFGLNLEERGASEIQTAIQLPAPHALLCARRAWTRYAIPYMLCGPRARALGLKHVMHAISDVEPQCFEWDGMRAAAADDAHEAFDLQAYQSVTDILRVLIKPSAAPQDTIIEASYMISRLQRIRDNMLRRTRTLTAHAYAMEVLLSALILTGSMRGSGDLQVVVQSALDICIPDIAARAYFKDIAARRGIVPSRATSDRAKLAAIVGICVCQQAETEAGLMGAGCIVYRTIDSSPQGGYDWVLQGARYIKVNDIVSLFHDAQTLIHHSGEEDFNEQEIILRLAEKLRWTQLIPTAIGSGRCSAVHKLHAAVHAERLRSPSWAATAALWSSTFAMVGDLGTESRLPQFHGNIKDLFGEWVKVSDETAVAAEHAKADQADGVQGHLAPEFDFECAEEGLAPPQMNGGAVNRHADQAWAINLHSCLYIPGVLHVVHKATEELSNVLIHFEAYIDELSHLTRLLNKRWSRSRLLATCFANGPQRAFLDLYSSFSCGVYRGRWGSLVEALRALLPLERSLRFAWDKDRFLFGNPLGNEEAVREGEGELKSVNVHKVDRAIRSDLFWAYTRALDMVGELLDEVCRWSESCPCHGRPPQLRGPDRHGGSRGNIRAQQREVTCPMSTCRAPELASGTLEQILSQLMGVAHGELLLDPLVSRLPDDERQLVLTDFVLARQHVAYFLRQKLLAPWKQLPYVVHGIAHADANVARACAQRALALYDGRAAHHDQPQHVLVRELCGPGGVGRAEMEAFCRGIPLSHLPWLLAKAARLAFVPVSERWVESRHAFVKSALKGAARARGVHVAWSFMHKDLCQRWQRNAAQMRVLAAAMAKTRNTVAALHAVGLFLHPTIQGVLQSHGGHSSALHKKARGLACDVIFHVDSDTMFRDYANLIVQPPDEDGSGGPYHPGPEPPDVPPDDQRDGAQRPSENAGVKFGSRVGQSLGLSRLECLKFEA